VTTPRSDSQSAPGVPTKKRLGWYQWRGQNRDGHADWLPDRWQEPIKNWSFSLPNLGVGGVVANDDFTIASSRDASDENDLFYCLDSATGVVLWQYQYRAVGELDYGNSPRATPILADPYVITLGAFGDLACLDLDTGEAVWKKNLVKDFEGQMPTWGYTASPLLDEQQLILQPGGKNSSLIGLDLASGELIWRTPGGQAAYASLVLIEQPMLSQLVGYDYDALIGWERKTGRKLWAMKPLVPNDFNVPTPVVVPGGIAVTTENNATRLYRFDKANQLQAKPAAESLDLAGDSHSPLRIGSMYLGIDRDLIALDLENGLEEVHRVKDVEPSDYCSIIAHQDRMLHIAKSGAISLWKIDRQSCVKLGTMATQMEKCQLLSHPAMHGKTLYLRGPNSLDAWSFAE
jgi:outer membrane protein assembly factor BamB